MRDDQVRRYSRHILLPDLGGLGQTALLVSAARLELRESLPEAELVAAQYLVAGGVGTLALSGASEDQRALVTSHGPDTNVVTDVVPDPDAHAPGRPRDVVLQPKPAWWPSADGDATALAFWRGGIAAIRWMSSVANT